MTSLPLFGSRALNVLAVAGLAGCGAASVSTRPIYPKPEDALGLDPCSVKREPDIFVRGASFDVLGSLYGNLKFLREVNPIFLCGLERIEALGDKEYKASADPVYTRRSVGLYTLADRTIRLKASAGITLTHEVGHHVYNLGPFASTVRDFLAQSWTRDASGKPARRCSGPDCFISDAAQEQPTEDWARTFEMVLMRPIETGAATNFSLQSPTPVQEKIRIIRSIAKLPEPVKGIVRFGKTITLDAAEALRLKEDSDSQAMPASLPGDTIRRIFVAGKRSVRGFVWDKRKRPFLAGGYLVFPVFRNDRKTLGVFAYDLARERFSPVTLDLEGIPEEFRGGNFSDLEIAVRDDGTLLLVVQRDGSPPTAAPVDFSF